VDIANVHWCRWSPSLSWSVQFSNSFLSTLISQGSA
jgi:hypothetical protein